MKKIIPFILFFFVSCAHKNVSLAYNYHFNEELLKKSQESSGRSPAALSNESIGQIYFKSLYFQTQRLALILGEKFELNHCPQFHQDLISIKQTIPINSESRKIDQVMKIALEKSKKEISRICETSESLQYFKVENLYQYHRNHASFHQTPGSFHALMKIPVFTNYYLAPKDMSEVEYRLFSATQTAWFKNYVDEVARLNQTKVITEVK